MKTKIFMAPNTTDFSVLLLALLHGTPSHINKPNMHKKAVLTQD